MLHLCETCSICSWLPKQDKPRLYKLEGGSVKGDSPFTPLVLVLDYLETQAQLDSAKSIADSILPTVQYTYSPVIRCESEGATEAELNKSSSRCAVWSRHLFPGRSVILSHPFGIRQMGITEPVMIGEIFISKAYGLVLPIESLYWYYNTGGHSAVREVKTKADRMLKTMRLR